ncbi:MAG: acyl-ACP--UDP-N-acetylglucosamine O-acyltransferase, partial [Polyangiaceae bacterium]
KASCSPASSIARSELMAPSTSKIHPTAVVDPRAEIAEGVEIGPYCVIGPRAKIARENKLISHVVVAGKISIGEKNIIHPFAVVGSDPQSKRHTDEIGSVEIGAHNEIREHVTIHAGTDGRVTKIGSHNLFMVGMHVAHDVVIGSHCIFANAVQLAGHSIVEDYAAFGGLSGIAQFVRVGESAFVAAGAMCERAVPPFVVVQGDRARVRAINKVGLRRRGIDEATISALNRAYRALFVAKEKDAAALATLETNLLVERLIAAVTQKPI